MAASPSPESQPPPEGQAQDPGPPEETPSFPESDATRILADVGFRTPESVQHDPDQDVYFVSNIGGDPFEKDGDGFIARVTPADEVDAKFIVGGQKKVTLHAPKGMAVIHDTLIVADIDVLRLFDRRTGAPRGQLKVEGATFLNDVAVGTDQKTIYVSDSGWKPGFEPSGTDAVYRVVDGKVSKLAGGAELGHPNGLWPDRGGTWVASFGTGELYFLGNDGKRSRVQKLDAGKLDGVVKTRDGALLVASWEASAILAGRPGEPFERLLSGVESPADIGYDRKRNRLLIPSFSKDALVLHDLDGSE